MAISDIPAYQTAYSGDLISADQWNTMQRQARNSLRTHQHTRATTSSPDDSSTEDVADQITTDEIADGAITTTKFTAGAISETALADGSVTATKIADSAVTTAKISNSAVTSAKLSFQTVKNGSRTLGPGSSSVELVQTAAPSTKTTIYFPVMALVGSTGTGISQVSAEIVYEQNVGSTTVDVYVRLTNSGAATASIIWQVLTFG
jgi:hypothetical protein